MRVYPHHSHAPGSEINLSGFDSSPLAASVSPERGNTPRLATGLFILSPTGC